MGKLAPRQKALFRFQPKIYIGVASQVQEGEDIDPAVLPSINTELDLFGISSADIVMTGGGSGSGATSFQFNLTNIT